MSILLGMKRLLIVVFTLIAAPAAAQDVSPSLSEQAIEAAKLRVQVERWGQIADRSMHTWALLSAAGLAMAGIEEQHPRRTQAINLAWAGTAGVWLVAHLRERHLRGRLEAVERAQEEPGPRCGSCPKEEE